jgi:hypothetical protein
MQSEARPLKLAKEARAKAPASFVFRLLTKLLLLAGNRLCRTLAGAGIGVRALAANRQRAAMAQTTVGTEIHETLDVHRGFAAKIAFHLIVAVDGFADRKNLGVSQLMHAALCRDTDLLDDLLSEFRTDPVDIGQSDDNTLLSRDVDASYTGHACSPSQSGCHPAIGFSSLRDRYVQSQVLKQRFAFTSKTTVPEFPILKGKAAPIDEYFASWRVNSGIA